MCEVCAIASSMPLSVLAGVSKTEGCFLRRCSPSRVCPQIGKRPALPRSPAVLADSCEAPDLLYFSLHCLPTRRCAQRAQHALLSAVNHAVLADVCHAPGLLLRLLYHRCFDLCRCDSRAAPGADAGGEPPRGAAQLGGTDRHQRSSSRRLCSNSAAAGPAEGPFQC